MKSVLIVINREKEEASKLATELQIWMKEKQLEPVVWDPDHYAGQTLPENCTLALVLGGDGTMLYAASLLYGTDIPLLGINLGNVGFITSTVKEQWRNTLQAWLEGSYSLSPRMMVDVAVYRDGLQIFRHQALNEGVIAAHGLAKIAFLEVNLSGVWLGEYRADGILVATPTGSTAYSLSAGGPIVHPEAEVFVLTPICPHSLTHRPIVIPSNERVTVTLAERQRTELGLTVDGHTFTELRPGDEVRFLRAPVKTGLILPGNRSFYELVRAKLQ